MTEPSGIANGFRFGRFSFDRDTGELFDGQTLVAQLAAQAFQVLVMLLDSAGKMVPRKNMVKALWPDGKEPEGALRGVIAKLRDVFGDDPAHPEYIETIHARGYKFIKPVAPLPQAAQPVQPVLEGGEAVSGLKAASGAQTDATSSNPPVDDPLHPPPSGPPSASTIRHRWQNRLGWGAAAAVVLLACVALYERWPSRPSSPSRRMQSPPSTEPVKSPAATQAPTITSPRSGDSVDHRYRIVVRVSRPGAGLCIVIHPQGEEGYHTQPDVTKENDGSWTVEGYFGVRGPKDNGRLFDIRAVAGCEIEGAAELTGWPAGTARSEIVTVTRR